MEELTAQGEYAMQVRLSLHMLGPYSPSREHALTHGFMLSDPTFFISAEHDVLKRLNYRLFAAFCSHENVPYSRKDARKNNLCMFA